MFLQLFMSVWLHQWFRGNEPTCQCRRLRRLGFNPWVRKIPRRRKWQPTPVFLPGESHGLRSLVGYSLGVSKIHIGLKLMSMHESMIQHQFSCSVMSSFLWLHGLQQARPPCPSPTLRAYSNSCPSSWWCYPTISSSVVTFSSCLQSFPASGYFPISQFFISGSQSIGTSTSAWVFSSSIPVNTQDLFPLGLTGLISLQSKGLSRVFSNATVQKHQFFSAQFSLWSNSHIHT